MIIDDLIHKAEIKAQGRILKDLRVGLGYTCAALENGDCGLAYTFRNELGHCCGVLPLAGELDGEPCDKYIYWAKDGNRVKAAIGLAVINALLNNPSATFPTGNVMDAFTDLKAGETFGMVGDFAPILSVVKQKTKNISIFERGSGQTDETFPDTMIPELLPRCDVVVITATSIINQTIDDVLPFCGKARQVCLVGPSTPLVPDVFSRYNVSLLAGSVVTDSEKMLKIVSQGGGTMQMKPALRHVLVRGTTA